MCTENIRRYQKAQPATPDVVMTPGGCLQEAAEHELGVNHSVTEVYQHDSLMLVWCDDCEFHVIAEQYPSLLRPRTS